MKNALTAKLLSGIERPQTTQTYYDEIIEGLSFTVKPNGERLWRLSCGCWTTRLTLPASADLSFVREKAIIALSELSAKATKSLIASIQRAGLSPVGDIPQNCQLSTLQELINEYTAAGGSRFIITTVSGHFNLSMDLREVTVLWAEQWRNKFIEQGHKIATGNRAVSALRTLLNWGEDRGLCQSSLRKIKMLPETDSNVIIRYLDEAEEDRLRTALIEFDLVFQTFIITELNTGIRLTALLSLQWNDIDFEHQQITLRASTAKNKTNKTVPMNSEVRKALLKLKNSPGRCLDCDDFVFINSRTKTRYKNISKLWWKLKEKAQIRDLRFHDLRHNFASQLVMNGVELNTVREVMTHSDLKMTLRYAHLAPDKKMKAVEKLVRHE